MASNVFGIAGFKDIYVLFLGIGIAVVCLVVGFLSYAAFAGGHSTFEFRSGEDAPSPANILLDWGVLGMMAVLFPYGFVKTLEVSKLKAIERRLPDFLMDVAEAGRFGLTLPEAIVMASKGRYGALGEEIRRMARMLEWGVPVREALELFRDRISTPLTTRVVSIIIKANEAGGSVADVLTLVAKDTKEIQFSEEARRVSMSTYLTVIYISFGVFLVTILIMSTTFLPEMIVAGQGVAHLSTSQNIGAVGISITYIPIVFLAFFVAVIVHAVGDGIMAGVLDQGKVVVGMVHAGVMLIAGWAFMRYFVPILNPGS